MTRAFNTGRHPKKAAVEQVQASSDDAMATMGYPQHLKRQVDNAEEIRRISLRVWPVGGYGPPKDLQPEEIAKYRAYIVQGRMEGWMSEEMASRALTAARHSERIMKKRLKKP
jgi:hypothetical protein